MINISKIIFIPSVTVANITVLCLAGYVGTLLFKDFQLMKKQIDADKTVIEENWHKATPLRSESLSKLKPLTSMIRKVKPDNMEERGTADHRFAVTAGMPDDALLLQAPLGKLPVVITGILASNNRHQGIAIIALNNQQRSYLPGDQLKEELSIVRIFPDRVIFNAEGFYVTQLMKKE